MTFGLIGTNDAMASIRSSKPAKYAVSWLATWVSLPYQLLFPAGKENFKINDSCLDIKKGASHNASANDDSRSIL